jgi:hypothetical protein
VSINTRSCSRISIEAKFFQVKDLEIIIQNLNDSQTVDGYEYKAVKSDNLLEFISKKWEVVSERSYVVSLCKGFLVPAELEKCQSSSSGWKCTTAACGDVEYPNGHLFREIKTLYTIRIPTKL